MGLMKLCLGKRWYETSTPPFAMAPFIILIGWTFYLRATFCSLVDFGLILAFCLFAIIIWCFLSGYS